MDSPNAYASSSRHTLEIPEIEMLKPPPPPPPAAAAPMSTQSRKQSDFQRYLAGQSVMKSGLTRDQAEVNAIIHEASKNSQFFKREKEKDELLNKRIEVLMRKISKLEATRDLTQKIVHVDLDAFYANVEEKRDPSLKGKAFAVGGGVCTTASYEARKYGVRSGMAGFIAKKLCPHLIFVKNNFADYSEASKQVREVLARYDENLAMAGLDEGYLNITPYMSQHDMSAPDVVSHLRAAVEAETGLTISAGIAPNKMLAKICSDKNKPDGQYELEADARIVRAFMRDLPIRRVPGVGRVAERILSSMGVKHAKELLEKEFPLKIRLLGIRMTHLKDLQGPQGGLDKVRSTFQRLAELGFGRLSGAFLADSTTGKKRSRSASRDQQDDIHSLSDDEVRVDADSRRSESASPSRKALRMNPAHGLAEPMNCPICGITLKNGTTNLDLNRHIDLCLRATSPEVISDDEIEIVEVSRPTIAQHAPPVQKRSRKMEKTKPPDKLQNAFKLMMPGK
ncbi:hypothetical protein QFC19_002872 [Naganishia cerealis]|uniref:Uncharacterized protein n=1 Tax=Naganishia cerealis TaxID=610337 RepID=A0ACC2W5I7_9TREE|nr:hypothetical protein QFC19_002872 [Naganishia cerealis]